LNRDEALGGVVLFFFGVVTVLLSLRMPIGTFRAAGTGLFPFCLGILLMVLSAALMATMMAHTRPGVPAKEVLQKGIEAYREKGYPEEWKLHHQGGSIGYTGRDYRTHFGTPDIVQENQAFTWNPSLTGTKSEDTILATSRGIEMITYPVLYPTLSVSVGGISFVRPAILVKGGGM